MRGQRRGADASEAVEGYLEDVAARLRGPSRSRASVLAELRSGLLDAIDIQVSAGADPLKAASAATAEFGAPCQVAHAFGSELAAAEARRVALGLLASGPVVGLLWLLAAMASHLGLHLLPPFDWAGLKLSVSLAGQLAAPLGAVALCIAILLVAAAAALALASTGRLARWVPFSLATTGTEGATVACLGAGATELIILAIVGAELLADPGRLATVPVTAAALASVGRLALAARAGHHCLAARSVLA